MIGLRTESRTITHYTISTSTDGAEWATIRDDNGDNHVFLGDEGKCDCLLFLSDLSA